MTIAGNGLRERGADKPVSIAYRNAGDPATPGIIADCAKRGPDALVPGQATGCPGHVNFPASLIPSCFVF
ncbi:hypothetical protein HF313_27465 [Massilia atriviolacea]|uniref:Uncharacterized protein n=1 Tax=Massilia atriviolacea TaxID=2495579 RepID=A0A430HJF3_9BURK|nr:hypothetical protein [Massilia atriviolacea]RSZ57642.1 hypothetical protein EJB06_18320 [Massilia atriviolacea]